jgi:hypothetical protein
VVAMVKTPWRRGGVCGLGVRVAEGCCVQASRSADGLSVGVGRWGVAVGTQWVVTMAVQSGGRVVL